MKDFINKINKNHVVIFSFIGILLLTILYTRDRKDIKNVENNEIKYSNKKNLNISINKIDNESFEITYKTNSFLDESIIDEKIVVKYKNLKETIFDNQRFYTFFSCSLDKNDKKKYFILLDISISVVQKVGKDKFVSDIDSKLRKIFEKTELKPGDQIEVRFFGDNKEKDLNFDFVGPSFIGEKKHNSVYKRNSFDINDYKFTKIYSCSGREHLPNTQELLQKINTEYFEKIKKPTQNSKISSTMKSINSDLTGRDEYSKIIYIMFTDAEDTEKYTNCYKDNCSYENINYSGNDEAYIIWSDAKFEEPLKQLFKGVNLIIY